MCANTEKQCEENERPGDEYHMRVHFMCSFEKDLVMLGEQFGCGDTEEVMYS